jgi:hypothetical protein
LTAALVAKLNAEAAVIEAAVIVANVVTTGYVAIAANMSLLQQLVSVVPAWRVISLILVWCSNWFSEICSCLN